MGDFNNKNLNTKSKLLIVPSIICTYISELIDGSIDLTGLEYKERFEFLSTRLKRLLYYNTVTPFSKTSKTRTGEIIKQQDIKGSLIARNEKEMENDFYIFKGLVSTGTKSKEKSVCFITDLDISEYYYNKGNNQNHVITYFQINNLNQQMYQQHLNFHQQVQLLLEYFFEYQH